MADSKRVFLYVEFEAQAALGKTAWRAANPPMHSVSGLRNRTLLSGFGVDMFGGFYEFDTLENARAYADGVLSAVAKSIGGGMTLRLFSGDARAEASRDTSSPYFGN